jgi:hypothetical protein
MVFEKKKAVLRRVAMLLAAQATALILFPAAVRADTDGSEIRIADRPDKLILQLGSRWAGVEFKLNTDAGSFPVPLVVDESGILKMDLGGSGTYTLSCIDSPVAVPDPKPEGAPPSSESGSDAPPGENPQDPTRENSGGIPVISMVLFFGGLLLAVGGLFAVRFLKLRGQNRNDDDEEDDDDCGD